MSRRALLVALVALQSTTLLSGTAAALMSGKPAPVVASAAPVQASVVHAAVHVAPVALAPRRVIHKTDEQSVRAPRPKAVHHSVRRAKHVSAKPAAPRLSFQQQVDQAVARIPGYHQGDTQWVVVHGQSHWGMTDLRTGVVYLSPTIPSAFLYDVVVHEWSHVLSVRVYGGDVAAAVDALNAYYGGSGLSGAERAADCMARQLGAHWTHYTPCSDSRWQAGAKRLLAGHQL